MQAHKFKNIQYYTSGKGSKFIVFLHENSLSSATFINQLEDEQLKQFRLLAIDLPGHGKSSWSDQKEKDYSLFGFRDIVVDLIQELKIEDFILAGHSFGGHVAVECLPYLENCKGIVIWGTTPASIPLDVSQLFLPNPDMGLLFKQDLSKEELDRYGILILNSKEKDFLVDIIKQADPQFRTFIAQSLANGKLADEIAILKSSEIPVAIMLGKDDPLINKIYLEGLSLPYLWQKKILYFENSGHSIQLDNFKKFNQTLFEFAKQTL